MANRMDGCSSYSEPSYVTSKNDLKYKFYRPDVSEMIMPATRALLDRYSDVPVDSQNAHVHKIITLEERYAQHSQRDKAWNMRPYPCIGVGGYLVPQLSRLPVYTELLRRLGDGQLLVDIGCFIGHDLRHLVNDGAPSESLYGIDIVDFWGLGFEMFRDRGRFNAHFTQADIMSSNSTLAEFEAKFDIISIFQVLHQWNWETQVEACKKLTRLSKPGSVVVGNQMGNLTAKEIKLDALPLPVWRHDEQSFARLWEEVGLATNTVWECSSWMRTFNEMSFKAEDAAWMEDGVRVLEFVVRRV